jgi:peptidoglycan-associated lipoprotein
MKLNKMILPLALALVATMATTGCRHSTTGLTKLPGMRGGGAHDTDLTGTMPIGGVPDTTSSTPGGPGSGITGTPLPPIRPGEMIQDRATLAANTVHFDYDSAVVKDKEQAHLANVAQALSSDPSASLLIEGHCDERGTEEYNRALGERRAGSIREALIHNGVDSQRVTTISFGKDHKIDLGNTDAAHAKNRRGEFVLLHAK